MWKGGSHAAIVSKPKSAIVVPISGRKSYFRENKKADTPGKGGDQSVGENQRGSAS